MRSDHLADISEFDDADHDREVFLKHLDGKSSDDALSVFREFKSTLKIQGLRELTDREFNSGFLNVYR